MKLQSIRLYLMSIGCAGLICGCTATQLKESSLAQSANVTPIEYEMVLDNLALFEAEYQFSDSSVAVPWYARIGAGDVQIKDTLTAGNPNFSYASGSKTTPLARTVGVSAARNVQVDWTLTPVEDAATLFSLRSLFAKELLDPNKWYTVCKAPKADSSYSGHYGDVWVSVDKANLKNLSGFTMQVLAVAAANSTNAITSGKAVPLYLTPGPVPSIAP